MKQTALDLNLSVKNTRKREFLEQMERVVPWAALVELIAPYYPQGLTGRRPFSLATMLRMHFMQQSFTLSEPGMEEAFFDTPLYREFAQLDECAGDVFMVRAGAHSLAVLQSLHALPDIFSPAIAVLSDPMASLHLVPLEALGCHFEHQ